MRLSDTNVAQSWLRNFRADERAAGELLLNSLYIASDSDVRAQLSAALRQALASKIPAPAAVAPVRDFEDFFTGRTPERPVAFEDFTPGSHLSAAPGSEAALLTLFAR